MKPEPTLLLAVGLGLGSAAVGALAWRLLRAYGLGPRSSIAIVLGAVGVGEAILLTTPSDALVWALMLGLALLVLSIVDLVTLKLPDALTLPLMPLGLSQGLLTGASQLDRLLGLALGVASLALIAALYRRFRGRSGLGLGDAKLLGAAGAWVGVAGLPTLLLLACAGGLLYWAVQAAFYRRLAWDRPVPFGMPLCAAAWIVWRWSQAG